MKPPDLSFMQKPEKPGERYGREPLYNTRVLVDNWFEDRRQYKSLCSRCTGDTIYQTEFQPKCRVDTSSFPPTIYKKRLNQDGEGWSLIRNSEDYCDYLQNYTTTYDLTYNWEVRRAGLKPKPKRTWKLIMDALWVPENDRTKAFGNLTQLGYRQAPQVPLLPNDWDVYANTETEYQFNYPGHRYPQDYTHCRKVPNREIAQEISSLTLVKKPKDPCDLCGENFLYQGGRTQEPKCRCICHQVEQMLQPKSRLKKPCPAGPPPNPSRFGSMMPCAMMMEHRGKQTLHPPKQPYPYKALKHPPHLPPVPYQRCEPSFARNAPRTVANQTPDFCKDYAGDVLHDYKGPSQEAPLCEYFMRR